MTVLIIEARGEMVVHSPAGVGHNILKFSRGVDVVLVDCIFAYIAAAFALSGKKAYPFKLPVIRAVVTFVFYMVPDSEAYFYKFLAAAVSIVHAVPFPA